MRKDKTLVNPFLKMYKPKVFHRGLTILLTFLFFVSCIQQPTVAPRISGTAPILLPKQDAFSISSAKAKPTFCLTSGGGVSVEGSFRGSVDGEYSWGTPLLDGLKDQRIPALNLYYGLSDDGNFTFSVKGSGGGGPYGFHLFSDYATVKGPISPGTSVDIPLSQYMWGSSFSVVYRLGGSARVSFQEDSISVSISGSGTMISPGSNGYRDIMKNSSLGLSGSGTAPISYGLCPDIDVIAEPAAISPKNSDGHKDESLVVLSIEPEENVWTLKTDKDCVNKSGNGSFEAFSFKGCGDGVYELTAATLSPFGGAVTDTVKISVDNTPPDISVANAELQLEHKVYSFSYSDPAVNGYASGVDSNSLQVEIFDANGGTISSSLNGSTAKASAYSVPAEAKITLSDNLKNTKTVTLALPPLDTPGPDGGGGPGGGGPGGDPGGDGPSGPGPRTPPGPVPEDGKCNNAPCPKPEEPGPEKTPKPGRTPKPRPTIDPFQNPDPNPTASPGGSICLINDTQEKDLSNAALQLVSLTDSLKTSMSNFANTVDGRNFLAFDLLNNGFSISSYTDRQADKKRQKITQKNQEINDLYFDIQDELTYLRQDRQILKEFYISRTAQQPTEPDLDKEPYTLLEELNQKFKVSRKENTIYNVLDVIYQETTFLESLTLNLLEQEVKTKNLVRLTRILRNRVKKHSEFVFAHPESFAALTPQEATDILAEQEQYLSTFDSLEDEIIVLKDYLNESSFSIQSELIPDTRPATEIEALTSLLESANHEVTLLYKDSELLERVARNPDFKVTYSQLQSLGAADAEKAKFILARYKEIAQRSLSIVASKTRSILPQAVVVGLLSIYSKAIYNATLISAAVVTSGLLIYSSYSKCKSDDVTAARQAANTIQSSVVYRTETVLARLNTPACQANGRLKELNRIVAPLSPYGKSLFNQLMSEAESIYKRKLTGQSLRDALDRIDNQNVAYQATALQIAQQIDEECSPQCDEEYQALKNYYKTMPQNIPIPNPRPTPKGEINNKNPRAAALQEYDDIRAQRESDYNKTLPQDLKYLAHALSGHGGETLFMTEIIGGKSSFFSDKSLIYYVIQAHEYRERFPNKFSYGFMGPYIQATGIHNSSTVPKKPVLEQVREVKYQFSRQNPCFIDTIHPVPPKK